MVNWSSGAGGAASGAAAGSVLGPWGTAGGAILGGLGGLFGGSNDGPTEEQLAARANYARLGGALDQQAAYMQRIARGQESVSAEQLRASLGQTMAQQRSMAAGAAPQNQAMANIQASRNAMNLGSGLAGQQAIAGMQERQQAQQALTQMLMEQRAQEQSVANFGAPPAPTWLQKWGPAISQGATLYAQAHGKKPAPAGQQPTAPTPAHGPNQKPGWVPDQRNWVPDSQSSGTYRHWSDPNYSPR